MESDEGSKQRKVNDNIVIPGDIFQSNGIRCSSEVVNGFNRKLLVFNFNFLPYLTVIFYILLLLS